jgi:glucan phosphoethanolaminetransferase (alkaline phosphatase superfamily)
MILHKVLKYLALVLCLVAAGFFIYTLSVGDDPIQTDTVGDVQNMTIAPMMYIAYATMAIILAVVIFFVFVNLFSSAAALKKSLLSVGILVGIILISYFVFATGSDAGDYQLSDGEVLTEGDSRMIGAAIWTFYIIAILAIGSILFAGANKLLKKR